ncbi:hypothetical protein ACIQTT_14210 [Microbacterium sp. NPDC090225]|uniref:hypothetical protein n=1 Tax=Microbacterium sp. NPDC090225 TaxID=3364207 RepID=UPI0037F2523D
MTSTRSLTTLFTALGLALLLVVGAWSTSHGEADVHASLCLASGASASDAGAGASHHDDVAPLDASSSHGSSPAALTGFVVLWFLALVVLLVRTLRRGPGILLPRATLAVAAPRAGPHPPRTALTLTELSISRT